MSRRAGSGFVAVLIAVGVLLPAGTAEANYVGAAADPVGDTTGGLPARDLRDAGMTYDRRTGNLFGVVELAADPDRASGGFLTLFAGVQTPMGCNGYPAVGFSSDTDDFRARWLGLNDPLGVALRGDADKRGLSSKVQRFEVTNRQLAGRPANCVIATLSEIGNSGERL